MAAMRAALAAPRGLVRFLCTNSATSSATPHGQLWPPSAKLFINGLNRRTTTERLRERFAEFGEVVHARVVIQSSSYFYSYGEFGNFGYVTYSTIEEAKKALEGMRGKYLDNRLIIVWYARPGPPPSGPENNACQDLKTMLLNGGA